MKLNRIKTSVLALVVLFLYSCGGGGEKAADSNAGAEFESAKAQVAADVKKVIQDLPPPSEVPYLLIAAGADFDPSLVNSTDNVQSYQSDVDKAALNLGVYASDIGYLSSYEKSEEALNYMGECQKLASPVGIADAIDYGMVSRFESNMENKDSLTSIINEVMEKSGERLSELDQLNSAALLLAGSWIEGMYISTMIVNNYPADGLSEEDVNLILEPLVQVVLKQKKSLTDLMEVMKDVPQSQGVKTTMADLEKVKPIYDGELAEVEKNISENTGGFTLSTSVLNNMATEVGRIRSSIVQ
ncbi:MAG: hypothetical protein ABJP45_12855 [Cyclobacteriaceae bacterium]